MFRSLSLLVALTLSFSLLCGCGGSADGPDKGGEAGAESGAESGGGTSKKAPKKATTPQECLQAAADACDAGDFDAFLVCIEPGEGEAHKALVRALYEAERYGIVRRQARERWGDEKLMELDQAAGLLSLIAPNLAALAKDGKVETDGDETKVKLEKKEGNATMSMSLPVTEIDGAWYIAKPKAEGERDEKMKEMLTKMAPAWKAFAEAAAKAMAENEEVEAFHAAMKPAYEKLGAAMKAMQEAGQKK